MLDTRLFSPLSPVCLLAAYQGWLSSAWAASSSSEPTRRSAALCYSSTTCGRPESWPDGENRKSVSGGGGHRTLLCPEEPGSERRVAHGVDCITQGAAFLLIGGLSWSAAQTTDEQFVEMMPHCIVLKPVMLNACVSEWVMLLKLSLLSEVCVSFESLWNFPSTCRVGFLTSVPVPLEQNWPHPPARASFSTCTCKTFELYRLFFFFFFF